MPSGQLPAPAAQRSRDLLAAQQEITRLREVLDRLTADHDELLSVVSHELRTPVTVIRGYNNLLLSEDLGALTDQQRDFLEQSNRSCERLDHFIGDLVAACGEAAGHELLELKTVPIDGLLVEVIAFLRPLLDERDLVIELRIDRDASRAVFDAPRIEQVLTNLLSNAIRFSKPGTSVCVRSRSVAAENHRFIEVSVIDTGPGIAPEDRERIFEPYVRAAVEDAGGGLGLGLAICKRIVAAHGGIIGVTDEPGWGSRFFFSLPAADEEAR